MGHHVSPKVAFLVISSFYSFVAATEMLPPLLEGPTKAPIGCHKRAYLYQVQQTDAKGYSCSDTIEVSGCWGRCDSKEVSDWKFPFKKSHHPVCIPASRTKVSITLKNCDPEASLEARRYDYFEPSACICKVCTSRDTSCEYPHHRGGRVTEFIKVDSEDSLLSDDYSSIVAERI